MIIGQESWRYDFRLAIDLNTEMARQSWRHQKHDLVNLLAFREWACEPLRCLIEINRLRGTGHHRRACGVSLHCVCSSCRTFRAGWFQGHGTVIPA